MPLVYDEYLDISVLLKINSVVFSSVLRLSSYTVCVTVGNFVNNFCITLVDLVWMASLLKPVLSSLCLIWCLTMISNIDFRGQFWAYHENITSICVLTNESWGTLLSMHSNSSASSLIRLPCSFYIDLPNEEFVADRIYCWCWHLYGDALHPCRQSFSWVPVVCAGKQTLT